MENQEVINYLLAYENFKIIQRKDMFNFSLDTVLLSHFCTINKDYEKIIDFGTNNAAIPLILSMRTASKIIGVEIQEEACKIAQKNIVLNHLENQIEIVHEDIKNYIHQIQNVDLVVCNPPFFKLGEKSNLNDNEYLQIARHEIKITLEQIIQSASKILKQKGRFAIVHRPERLIDIITIMKTYDIEPKRIQLVYPKHNRECNTILVEGMYKGNPGLKILPPLYAHDDSGEYSKEVRKLFGEQINE
ncbi:MAG: tRNA1(Val) (adenine(37)-N6)-methyltransferase [Erysipelotrichaceae bacterium]|nr:tRNA1(Val) (adenine(37)-N6)-methyltransferase [Erysipelotrichaceae bacterium]